jgi:cytochrome P450
MSGLGRQQAVAVSAGAALATADCGLPLVPPTGRAQRLPPSVPPQGAESLFVPRPFDTSGPVAVITRYEDVLAALLNLDGIWGRGVPEDVIAAEDRHCTLEAAWSTDEPLHKRLRGSLARINKGATPQARAFTRELTGRLLAAVMAERPPWDLTRVIYEVSMRLVIEQTLQAPLLLPHLRRLRELIREHVTAPGGYFGIRRQPEAEEILGTVIDRRDELPEGGLARHLVDLHMAPEQPRRRRVRESAGQAGDGPEQFPLARAQVIGQLWLLAVSSETQATATASLLGMLLEFGEYAWARNALGRPAAAELLIAEGYRLGIAFPASLLRATRPFTLDGQTIPAGTPCLASSAAANRDPAAFGDPQRFDPRAQRDRPHLAFGFGGRRCSGATGAEQFTEDVLTALVRGLPERVTLEQGTVCRETGISMSVSCLPVTSGPP